jgi:hypothetical protein
MAGREDRKAELIAALARARTSLDRSATNVREALDVPARVRRSFSNNFFTWLGGAALAGVVLAKLPARKRKVYVNADGKRIAKATVAKTGLLLAAMKIAFDLARPALVKVVSERLQPMIEQWFQRRHEQL